MHYRALLAIASSLPLAGAKQAPICEDTIDSQPPFNNNNIPCLLGCNAPLAMATGGLLPGSINETGIPYCRLNCVRPEGVTPAQSSAAPACNERCEKINAATPDQLGWCIYWCVQGGSIESMVVSTTCVPSIQYTPVSTTTVEHGQLTYTIQGFTMPTQWASWYQTQTVIPRTTSSRTTTVVSGGYYDGSEVFHASSEATPTSILVHSASSETTVARSCDYNGCSGTVVASTISGPMTTSRAQLTSTTSMTAPATEDAQAQSAETQPASTTTAGSGSSEVYRPQWVFQALLAWLVAFA